MAKGKLIVIEGSDGSGKGTQLNLLVNYLKKKKISFEVFDFPQYEKTFFGNFVGRFLNGEFGHLSKINPYLSMFPYAGDRWQVKEKIYKALNEKKLVVCNRYAPSVIYQAVKVKLKERDSFLKWASTLEYKVFKIPKEDLVIFLYVPMKIAQILIEKKDKRGYLNNKKKDIHEENVVYLEKVEKMYLWMINRQKNWVKIDCVVNDKILPPNKIHQKVLKELAKKHIL